MALTPKVGIIPPGFSYLLASIMSPTKLRVTGKWEAPVSNVTSVEAKPTFPVSSVTFSVTV